MKKIIGIFLGCFLALLATCSIATTSGSWKYKMTVVIDTPEGTKIGSAVREVTAKRGIKLWSEGASSVRLKGEAVVIDLGKRGYVFALLKGEKLGEDYGAHLPAEIFYPERAWLTSEGIKYMRSQKTASQELSPEWYPMFVHFKEINIPKTVESLIEMEGYTPLGASPSDGHLRVKADHFEEILGRGVRLKSLVIETTDEPITTGVDTVLRWLPDYYNKRLDGKRYGLRGQADLPIANSLSSGAFSTGVLTNGR